MTYVKSTDANLGIEVRREFTQKSPLRVVITEAVTYISRSLAYLILTKNVFGEDQELILSLFDSSPAGVFLEGIAIEISASAPSNLFDIQYSRNPAIAFEDADYVFSVGKSRDYNLNTLSFTDPFLKEAVQEMKADGQAVELYAKKTAKIITLGNTAARVISHYAPKIPKENITGASYVLQKLINSSLAKKTRRLPNDIKNVIIWGTISKFSFPYCRYAKFSDGKFLTEEIKNDYWFKKILPKAIKRFFTKCSYRTSEAIAMAEHCKYWIHGTPEDEWICMGVVSDGSYGIPAEMYFSFPVYCKDGKWKIVQGLYIDTLCKTIIQEYKNYVEEKIEVALKLAQQEIEKKKTKGTCRKSIIKLPMTLPLLVPSMAIHAPKLNEVPTS